MAIQVADGFEITTNIPVDDRFTVADLTARDAMSALVRYEGLATYVTSEEKTYRLIGGITNSDWKLDGGLDPSADITYIKGNETTDGSIRINTTDGTFTIEKRIAGVWTFIGSFGE